ncbi:hypothetical protein FPV16_20080 [Methylobacterium sp. W2]|uniref:hypothetical protein n=1 Tax=Methylobacterium sp. W2 TaxID=2598107 RepID=UPI001D0C7265|nr:hypothetical protein [Methylobacterium sp. W2]MCC0808484.1 hypothetical protein [Methylobacterium sp. W2]
MSNPAEVPLEAPVGKVGRSFGPNVMGAIFAPVGIIVAPINEGLRAIDTAIAPINVALRPLTGRIAVPAGEPSVIPAATVPGPRK